jgi:hypothetical protein
MAEQNVFWEAKPRKKRYNTAALNYRFTADHHRYRQEQGIHAGI